MLSRNLCMFLPLLFFSAIGMMTTSSWILFYYQTYFPLKAKICACDQCIMNYTEGISELLNQTVDPFMTTENNLSQSLFNWWSHLQPGRRTYKFYNETLERVFQIFPPSPKWTKPSSERCMTCAVVGNSGNLNGSHYGPLIDYHDIVIRINKAPIKGYERDVGTKTTHHVMYPVSASNLDNTTHLLFFAFKTRDLEWLVRSFTQSVQKNNKEKLANKDLVMILNPEFIKYVHYVWLKKRGKYPSTGFLTLILSLHMCDEVDVFGFGADKKGNWNHYFEELKNKKLGTGQHPGNNEFKIIMQLDQLKKIRFFRGW